MARWWAFRRYLVRFSSLPEAPAAAIVIWEQYLVYAVALGAGRQVEKQVRAVLPELQMPPPLAGGPGRSPGLQRARVGGGRVAPVLVIRHPGRLVRVVVLELVVVFE